MSLTWQYPVYFLSQSPAIQRGRPTYGWPIIDGPFWDGVDPGPPGSPGAAISPELVAAYTSLAFTTMTMFSQCIYTRWIDIQSTTLTKWTKMPNSSTSAGANSLVFRNFTRPFQDYDEDPGAIIVDAISWTGEPIPANTPIIYSKLQTLYQNPIINPVFWTFNPDETIAVVDLSFLDEYNTRLVAQTPYYNNATTGVAIPPAKWDGGFSWNLGFICEL